MMHSDNFHPEMMQVWTSRFTSTLGGG